MSAAKLKRLRAAGWKIGSAKDFLRALETNTALAEKRKTFVAHGHVAEKDVERTGMAYPASEVHRYLRARVAGRKTKRPKPARW